MKGLSRRDFGKKMSAGSLGSWFAASAVTPFAGGRKASSRNVKPMSAVLREMIKSPGIISSPAIYDPISARTAEWVGFRHVDLAGSALGVATCICEPALSLEDVAEATWHITAAVNIPLTVDAGAGFGEPAHVFHTVRLLEHAGAAGMHIEDQIYPKRFHYHVGVEHTIPAEAMVEKIHWAVEARRDQNFVIIGRTDAMRTHSFAEGIRRANLYAEAGADVIQVFPNTVEEARQAPKEVQAPLNYVNGLGGAGGRPTFSIQELEAMGYKFVFHAFASSLASYKAVRDVLVRLKEKGSSGMEPAEYRPIAKEMQEVIGMPEYIHIENATTEKT
ncbi:MAG TPA: isocitrate lyase/PEP mutase family protein [Terriglobia bacterium]|nr:isocitrate lyase/PEP mutase family protein [Terriglobia bacterium]